jgi:glycosyltransferase involved in cell wall biosynthesis
MHFPLAIALTRVIEEFKIPTVARHHDFWWERKRFLKSSCFPFFKRWFPPISPNIKHVTINSITQRELIDKLGINSEIIPDTFDYVGTKNVKDKFNSTFRKDFGIAKDDIVFLQATRIVPRKRIEISIELVKKLNNPKIVLVVAGKVGDEGRDYIEKLQELTESLKVRVLFVGDYIDFNRKLTGDRRKIYTLWDAFISSDFVTYPSSIEGFGNQYIEAVYFKKPVIITPYPVYKSDIKPLGFKSIEISAKISAKDLKNVKYFLNNPLEIKKMTEANFLLGKSNFSYEATEEKIDALLKI